jgi:hormone-sensitive lipase
LWANETKVPIFSIDYRLSPQYQFPSALNDCWQVYYWLVKNAESHYGINPKKIIIVGDSAGGNLAAAITVMAITRGFRVPDGLILAYPGKTFVFIKAYLIL